MRARTWRSGFVAGLIVLAALGFALVVFINALGRLANEPAGPIAGVDSASPTPMATARPTLSAASPTAAAGATVSTVIPGREAPVGQVGTWQLLFSDDFAGQQLDATRWHTCFWWATNTCSIESNLEQQVYNPEDVLVADGMLRLRAQQRSRLGWNGRMYPYTSGMVSTGGRKYEKAPGFTYTYGYVEARARAPRGAGLWSAFWLLPADYTSTPEVDVLEILGQAPRDLVFTIHWISTGLYGERQNGTTWSGPDFSDGWHIFGLDWRPGLMVWYVDGVERYRFAGRAVPSEPMYLLFTLAVGGDWSGPPDSSTPFPSYFDVQYVRVWARSGAA